MNMSNVSFVTVDEDVSDNLKRRIIRLRKQGFYPGTVVDIQRLKSIDFINGIKYTTDQVIYNGYSEMSQGYRLVVLDQMLQPTPVIGKLNNHLKGRRTTFQTLDRAYYCLIARWSIIPGTGHATWSLELVDIQGQPVKGSTKSLIKKMPVAYRDFLEGVGYGESYLEDV